VKRDPSRRGALRVRFDTADELFAKAQSAFERQKPDLGRELLRELLARGDRLPKRATSKHASVSLTP